MASQDLFSNVLPVVALNSTAISSNTTTNGNIIDTQNFEALMFQVYSGTITDGAYAITLQHGDASNLSDATSVPSEFILGGLADAGFVAADDNTVKSFGYVGHKRYVRMSIVSTTVSSGGTLGAIALKGRPRHAPANS